MNPIWWNIPACDLITSHDVALICMTLVSIECHVVLYTLLCFPQVSRSADRGPGKGSAVSFFNMNLRICRLNAMTGRKTGSGASCWPRGVRHWPCNWNTPQGPEKFSLLENFVRVCHLFTTGHLQLYTPFENHWQTSSATLTQFSPPAPFLCWGQSVDLLPAGWDRPTNNFGSVSSSSDGTPSPPIYATTCRDPAVMTSLTLPQTHPPPPHEHCEEEEGFEGQLRGLFTPAAVSSSPCCRTIDTHMHNNATMTTTRAHTHTHTHTHTHPYMNTPLLTSEPIFTRSLLNSWTCPSFLL